MNNPRNRVSSNVSSVHRFHSHYYDNDVDGRDKRLYYAPPRRRITVQNVIPRDSFFEFDIPRSPSLQSRGTSDLTDTNYESSEETTSEDGYYSGDRPLFAERCGRIMHTMKPVVLTTQNQLTVPDVRLRSNSTSSSPEIRFPIMTETGVFAQNNVSNTLAPYGYGGVGQSTPLRKHSYGSREVRRSDEHDALFNRQPSPDLKSSYSFRRRLPPTPDQLNTRRQSSQQNLQTRSFESPTPSSVANEQLVKRGRVRSLTKNYSAVDTALACHFDEPDDKEKSMETLDVCQPMLFRQGTGRKLPKVPDFSREIKTKVYHQQCMDDETASVSRPCKTPPPLMTNCVSPNLSIGYQPKVHARSISSPNSRKLCHRRTSDQSIEQYVGVPCTCTTSSTNENLESKSSSDTEDHAALVTLQDRSFSITSSNIDSDSGVGPSFPRPHITEDIVLPDSEKTYGLGHILFSMQYFSVRKRLRISVIKAEGLAGRLKPNLDLNTFVKVCLMPGKLQKQHGTRVVKGSRDANFNEEFFFDNITPHEIRTLTLAIHVCHHVGKQFQKDVVIGEVELALNSVTNLTSKHEIKIQRELRPKLVKKLGRIHLSVCLEVEARRLTINVFKVTDLPKFGITGAPDPCIKITVDQNGRVQTKQTRTLKNTCNASFKEAVMFLVSVRPDDLENADIDIAVMDTARDDVIGHVFMGARAKEKAEIDQWKSVVASPGKEVKGVHTLRYEEN